MDEKVEKKKGKKKIIILIIVLLLILGLLGYFLLFNNKPNKKEKSETKRKEVKSEYRITTNALTNFDLAFLSLNTKEENKIYSPLSIKYAMEMLKEGSKGKTRSQIDSVIGEYKAKKYTNSNNMSLANAIFIQEDFKDEVKDDYVNTLKSKYNAEIIYDSFKTPTTINNWVSGKTFKLINNLVDDVSDNNFVLVNALAIDMEWVKKIQNENDDYMVHFDHENFSSYVSALNGGGYSELEFKHKNQKAKSVEIAAVANKYDIIKDLGEDHIRKVVGAEYKKYLEENPCGETNPMGVDEYLDKYIKEIGTGYKHISSSTDFKFYDDANVKVFSKELKEYDGNTLEYIAIMPKTDSLSTYIENADADTINDVVNKLKEIKLESFDDNVISLITGYIPMFNFEYELKLREDLMSLGITDVFDPEKADLSGIVPIKGEYVDKAVHKANIEFSNDGIKAAAATAVGGKGAASCGFVYDFDVPIKKIDMSFDNPYMFMIRDKETKEVWFMGTVYEPIKYEVQLF